MNSTYTLTNTATLFHADCRDALRVLPDNCLDSVVTDPPYALVSITKRLGASSLDSETDSHARRAREGSEAYGRLARGFMGKTWDNGETAFSSDFWVEVLRVLKPGGHVAAFGASRGYHRMAVAIEDAGFEIRDSLMWLYGTGFPKSHDVALDHEKTLCERIGDEWRYLSDGESLVKGEWRHPAAIEWDGFGTAIKPSFEPIVLARKPLSEGTVAANVLRWRTGALNIDACRVPTDETIKATRNIALGSSSGGVYSAANVPGVYVQKEEGRWPANVVHDGSAEVVEAFPTTKPSRIGKPRGAAAGEGWGMTQTGAEYDDSGSAARFFYSAKASRQDRAGSKHPTVKPIALMQWLARLITPPGGTILDPFAGSGTTGVAAGLEGFNVIMCEREDEYVADIRCRFESPGIVPE